MTTLVESRQFDYLAPQCLEDGTLLYIRRPYSQHEKFSPLRAIKDLILFPFRLLYAIVHYLNFFSAIYTGRKLTSGGAKAREMDMKQMMVWGNVVRAQRQGSVEEAGADLVPKSWQLCSRTPMDECKVLAAGVLAYDLGDDGRIVFTNGNAIYLLHPDGRKEHVLNERLIEQVFFVRD